MKTFKRRDEFAIYLHSLMTVKKNDLSDKDENFNPNQPRDEYGRWTTTGASGPQNRDYHMAEARKAFKEARVMTAIYQSDQVHWHVTDESNVESIEQNGFEPRLGPLSEGMTKLTGTWFFPEHRDAWWFQESIDNIHISEPKITAGYLLGDLKPANPDVNMPTNITQEDIEIARSEGYIGFSGNEMFITRDAETGYKDMKVNKRPVTYVFDTDRIMARGEMLELYSEVQGHNSVSDIVENFNPNQPRDDQGRWTTTGTGSSQSGSDGFSTRYSSMTPKEFSSTVKEEYGSQATWTEAEKEVIGGYTASTHSDINSYLRGKEYHGDRDFLDAEIKNLDSAMKNSLKEDTVLYRGYATEDWLVPGTTITDSGYSSTSFFERKGQQFAIEGAKFSDKKLAYVLKINARKGQEGIIPLVESDSIGTRGVEAEFILPRGKTFEVTRVKDKGTYEEVEVEIL